MKAKLTLKLDKAILERARSFARANNVSISILVENYLDTITKGAIDKDIKISPTVRELSGSIKIRVDADTGELRDQYLQEKYLC